MSSYSEDDTFTYDDRKTVHKGRLLSEILTENQKTIYDNVLAGLLELAYRGRLKRLVPNKDLWVRIPYPAQNGHIPSCPLLIKERKISNIKIPNPCLDCKKTISNHSKRCKSCSAKHKNKTKIKWPPIEVLIQLVEDTSFSAAGRKLGVSDNAIRKHIKNHF